MRNFYFTYLFLLFTIIASAQQAPFITTWEVGFPYEVIIPATGSGYNYSIDFGDGNVQHNVTGSAEHNYYASGVFTISIWGDFPRIRFSNKTQLKSVEQWGDMQWESLQGAFGGCTNMVVNALDAPDLSQITDLSSMFYMAYSLNQSIDHWDVSTVEDMSLMFYNAHNFNQSLNNWDVSNVTNMSGMFWAAYNYNQPLNNWDVSNVVNMESMFGISPFNQSLNSWNVSNVTSMQGMFTGAQQFNQSLDNWDVSNVETMGFMFQEASSFNQNIENWNVSNVTDMGSMFSDATSYNQPLDNWDVSSVTNMSWMFYEATSFNQPLNNWDVSSVLDMEIMFKGVSNFNYPLDNWDVSNVINMSTMFWEASSFNQPIGNWDVSSVTDISSMFWEASSFNQPLNNWNVSNVINMSDIFNEASSFNQPLNEWDVSNVTNMSGMFYVYENSSFNQPLDSWNVSNVIDMSYMFSGTTLFDQPIDSWNVSNVTNMTLMFFEASSFNQSLNEWDVSNVTNMERMFQNAYNFNQPLNDWDISNVTEMIGMFSSASSFDQDLSNWQFGTTYLYDFLNNSGFSIYNFDTFLSNLVALEMPNGTLGAEGLEYCNQVDHDYLENYMGWNIYGEILSNNCNTISGTILYDQTNDGCDDDDFPINGFMVNVNDGTHIFSTFSINGNYNFPVYGNDFEVSINNLPEYLISDPISATVTFTDSNIEEVDFCITSIDDIEDLNIRMLTISDARPGFEGLYQLIVENMGTNLVGNVSVSLTFNDEMQGFLTADPSPITTTNEQLNFEFVDIPPFGRKVIDVTMQTFQPPIVEGGDILNFTATVSPNTNDYTPDDNTYVLEQVVVNSFDPNDKQVMQGQEIYIDEIDNYLDYLIRFQNTGTASAINVRILDTLHPKLDWSTIRPINASHDYRIEISNGNEVEFIFDDIYLPHEAGNEPESHGWVAYKIKPKSNVQVGDVISGDASIYFDYNPPIITNMVFTEIVDEIVDVADNTVLIDQIRIYPNPTDKTLNIYLNESVNLEEVIVYNIQGQEIIKLKKRSIDVGNLSDGIYLIKIITDQGTVNRRFIKM